MEILFSNNFVTIAYYSKKSCLIQAWTSFCTSEEFREVQKKSVEFIEEKHCHNFISDATNAGVLRKKDTDWVTQVITPQLIRLGVTTINVVVASSAFTQKTLLNLGNVEHRVRKDFLIFHENLKDALKSLP